MAIIAKNIVILNKQEAVPSIRTNEPVKMKVSAAPVVRITANVAVVSHPDFVNKSSDYVTHMFHK